MKHGLTPAAIAILTMWLVVVGALFQKISPRLTKIVQVVIILAGFSLLLYLLFNRVHHRG